MNVKALLLALLCGAGAVALGHLYLERLESEVSGGEQVSVLVAADDLPVGTTLSKAQVALRELPSSYVDRRHIRAEDAKKVLGIRVSTGLRANDAVLWTDLARGRKDSRELSALVQEGMRAIQLMSSHLFDGLLRPGDRVDVLFTAGSESNETTTLLQNLLVLSVDGHTGSVDGDEAAATGRSVTLSVTGEQAQLLVQAEQHGSLRLVVRNAEDIVLVEGLPATSLADVHEARQRLSWQPMSAPERPAPRDIEHVQ